MFKLGKLARVIGTIAANPKTLAKVLLDPDEHTFQDRMAETYGLGKGLQTIDLLDLIPDLAETINPYCFMNGSSRTIDLALLKGLARRFTQCRYLEIGTLRGESVANVAGLVSECVSVSLSDAEMQMRGLTGNYQKNNGLFIGNIPNLIRIGHDSSTFDFSPLGRFDLIFIDGDHSYAGVKKDTEIAFSLLRDEASIIVWHDYGWEFETPRWSNMAGILDGAPAQKRGHIYHVSNTLCAIYVRGEFMTSIAEHPVVPNKVFTVHISARKL